MFIDLDDFRHPLPPVPIMNRNMWECYRESLRRSWLSLDVDRPRANVIDHERERYEWCYPAPRLFFVEYRGVQYAIIEHSADDAISIVEYSERYQAWK